MSWLNQSRVRLQEIDAARQTAEYELSDKNRDLAINNLVLQELTTGLPLPELLDRFILTIESNHPGLIGSVLLADPMRPRCAMLLLLAWAAGGRRPPPK